ncbi:MAG: vanadium-dependent haloperoxidase [Planctomycetes bacterium]|nr:vanadium-dependent haloperoxidase [Planctomycetota bacterium]
MSTVLRLFPGTLFAAALVALLPACNGGGGSSSSINDSPRASTFAPDVATGWFDLLYTNVKSSSTAPPPASRIYGYASIALYESIVRGMPDHQSLQGQLVSFPAGTIPEPVNAPHHWPTVANRALAVVAASFFPAAQVDIDALEDANLTTYEATQTQAVIDRSVQYGEDVANAVLTWAAGDGFAGLAACNAAYVAPLDPASGGWVATGPNQGVGAFPCWGTLRTFAVTDADECPAVGAPPYSESTTSAYYGQALVVYGTTGDAGANLTTDQDAIARFWADNAGATGTPGGHWICIVRIVAEANDLKLDVAAEAYARVGLAIHDAFITCWRSKYDVYLQRPITYIQANIDPTWDPLLGTPGFPAYTSGHSTQSGAAATVLTGLFGPLAFTDTTHSDLNPGLGVADRSFANFLDAANEAAVSRLYGGIHWPFDNQDGFNQGQCVGEIINTRVHFLE